MMLFSCALVLSFMLFFHEIETSTNNVRRSFILGGMITDKDRNRVDPLATSRLTKHSALKHNPTTTYHEALDLHRYPPNIQESSHQPRSKEVLDSANQYKMKYDHSSQGSSSTIMTQNDQIQQQGTSGQSKRIRTAKERKVIAAKLAEAKRIYKLKIGERSQLFQSQEQRVFEDNSIAHFQEKAKYKETLKLLDKYYPAGLPHLKPQSYTSSEKLPPALHKMNDSITKGGYIRKKTKGAMQKDVTIPHDQSSQQSQVPGNPYEHFEPVLIYNHNSGFNPYLENQGQHPNLYYQGPNHHPYSQSHDPNYNPNLYYHGDHHGGSASGYQH